tara:strand:+ start:133 stop:645 length:513 start_codon:yes stop_codon:yes gene_type:complete
MKLGDKNLILSFFFIIFFNSISISEDKILSTPLINLDKLKPSFEESNDSIGELNNNELIKSKKKDSKNNGKSISAKFFGLDKITAKSSVITVNLGEIKKFGPLEIKVLKCGKVKLEDKIDNVAYLQVKDITKNENEKVFIFNGWIFASDPNITPFDHAIYDLQLISCDNI